MPVGSEQQEKDPVGRSRACCYFQHCLCPVE